MLYVDFILLVSVFRLRQVLHYIQIFLVSTSRKGLRFLRLFRQYFAYAKEYITSDWFLV